MNKVEEFVLGLTDERKTEILANYEEFSKKGVIGDVPIRIEAERLSIMLHGKEEHVAMWMNQLGFECYRYFGKKYLEICAALNPKV